MYLSDSFIENYPDFPAHMNELGKFVFYRTYSRFGEVGPRRETWKETVRRAVEYNITLASKHYAEIDYKAPHAELQNEAQTLFDNIFNLRQALSGRTFWVGGTKSGVADKYPLANFNCSFVDIRSYNDVGDLFYLLLVGTGVGFKVTKKNVANLAPVRRDIEVTNKPYEPLPKMLRRDDTVLRIEDNVAYLEVGDSKEGWVEALRLFCAVLADEEYDTVYSLVINYDSVRPRGERLKTFGGTASGPEPLMEMFLGFMDVIHNRIDPWLDPPAPVGSNRVQLRPIHIMDLSNLIGANVVVGGVRRTSEICLCDSDDYEIIFAKYGINGLWGEEAFKRHDRISRAAEMAGVPIPKWWGELAVKFYTDEGDVFNPGRQLEHRRMSNNSMLFESKPAHPFLNFVFELIRAEGEPGFVNIEEARRRRPNAEGLNPCAEILLDSYGVCNLTTVNLMQFVKDGELDIQGLYAAQRMSARAGLRMTLVQLELPHWDKVQQRDRLLGCSLTGVKDAMAVLGFSKEDEEALIGDLEDVATEAAVEYAKLLRVNAPLLITTVKPEGTLSQVFGGVSSGLHWNHAPYYIRRIRINSADALARAVIDLGWPVNPEVGTPGDTYEERMANARTYVIDFPVKSGASVTKHDVNAQQQLDTYFRFQRSYTQHNSSNTITVRPHEWNIVQNQIYTNWDDFTAVSFLDYDGGSYELAPYEAITEAQYEELAAKFASFDPAILERYEVGEDMELDDASCDTGVCPVR